MNKIFFLQKNQFFCFALGCVLATVLLLSWGAAAVEAQGRTFRLSMLPRYSSTEIMARISPLAQFLSRELDANIEPIVVADFKAYEQRLNGGDIMIGYQNPYICTLVSEHQEVLAMASKPPGGRRFRGIIIIRSDSSILGLKDLKGKIVSIAGKTSAGGYLSQKLTLARAGLIPGQDFQVIEAMKNKQENVVLSVFHGDADAGFIRESALKKVSNYIPMSQIRILKHTDWLPNWALSVNRSLPDTMKQTIRTSLLNLKKGDPVLKALLVDRFLAATDADYDIIRTAAGLSAPNRANVRSAQMAAPVSKSSSEKRTIR